MKKIISYTFLILLLSVAIFSIWLTFFKNDNSQNTINIESQNTNVQEENNLKKFKIIAVGDSLTAGYGLPLSDSYPMILERELLSTGKSIEVINAGISGETTAGLLERAEFISNQDADMVLITIGGNDFFRNLPIENTRKNIESIIEILKKKTDSKNIYLMEIQATANLGLNYRSQFNKMYKEIAKNENIKTLPFVVSEVFLDSGKMQSDSIHPNKDGYEYIVRELLFDKINSEI